MARSWVSGVMTVGACAITACSDPGNDGFGDQDAAENTTEASVLADARVDARRDVVVPPADTRDVVTPPRDVFTPPDVPQIIVTPDAGREGGMDAATMDAMVDAGPVEAGPPPPFAVTAAADGTMRGGEGGTLYEDLCPPGQVVTGIDTQFSGAGDIIHFAAVCGLLGVGPGDAGVAADGGLSGIALTTGSRVPVSGYRGNNTSALVPTPHPSQCPAGEAVVGFSGSTYDYMDPFNPFAGTATIVTALGVRCAPLGLDTDNGMVTVGRDPTAQPVIGGGSDPQNAFADANCPDGTFARGFSVRAGDFIDSLLIRCGTAALRVGP